jgi:hypothetical protein
LTSKRQRKSTVEHNESKPGVLLLPFAFSMCSRSKQKYTRGKEEIYAARQFFSAAFPKRSFRRFSSGTSGAAEQPLP